MRKVLSRQRKESPRRSNTIAKSQLAAHQSDPLRYYIGIGNNGELIKRILSTRKGWQQSTDPKELFINLRWQQSNKTYKYENCVDNRIFKHSLNHFEHHQELSSKDLLFKNLHQYCQAHKINVFQFVPLTFVLSINDPLYESQQASFLSFYKDHRPSDIPLDQDSIHLRRRRGNPNHLRPIDKHSLSIYSKHQLQPHFSEQHSYLWILKPTSYNRGNGVHVFASLQQLQSLMNRYIQGYSLPSKSATTNDHSVKKSFRIRDSSSQFSIRSSAFVIQKYLQRPLLFMGRKFDIRMWVLFTHQLKVHLFKQGYMRTSSYQYELNTDLNVHLTNNAVQKYSEDYGRYEDGNQLGFDHLKQLVEGQGKNYQQLLQMLKAIVRLSALSVRRKLNKQDRSYCFQIFGYDFMLDEQCRPFLIQVNTNPCIEESSPVLRELLPRMLDDAFAITIDRIFGSERSSGQFYVQGQKNGQNLWEFIVDLRKN